MFIDTHSKESMEASVCSCLHTNSSELYRQLSDIGNLSDDDVFRRLNDLASKDSNAFPDEILFFHFTRRLNSAENETEGKNLADLLLTDNSFSFFLRSYGITFAIKEHPYIDVYYKGQMINWDNYITGNSKYMKLRLGYYKGREDFCFNGFALKDCLLKNGYAKELFCGPEIIEQLGNCLGLDEMKKDYQKNSKYFCFEYKFPMSRIIFDGHEEYSDILKQKYLLTKVLQRLCEYQTLKCQPASDDNNLILRLPDTYTAPSEYYVTKEEVTLEMLTTN